MYRGLVTWTPLGHILTWYEWHGATTRYYCSAKVGLNDFKEFQWNDVRSATESNVQMGLPERHSVLVYYETNWTRYQAVLVSMSSAPSKNFF